METRPDYFTVHWRAIPDRTLATCGRKGTNVQTAKDRLTALLCCNATGDDKIDPLVIGKAARPTAFGPKKEGGSRPVCMFSIPATRQRG